MGQSLESGGAPGTLIHHAPARAIGPLVITVIEPPFRALLMLAARRADRGVTTGARGTGREQYTWPRSQARQMPKDRVHARHVRTRSADSTRPQRRAPVLEDQQPDRGKIATTDSACRSVESVTRAWRFRSRSSPSIAQPRTAYPATSATPTRPPPPPVHHRVSTGNNAAASCGSPRRAQEASVVHSWKATPGQFWRALKPALVLDRPASGGWCSKDDPAAPSCPRFIDPMGTVFVVEFVGDTVAKP